jgi:hypothetical protein
MLYRRIWRPCIARFIRFLCAESCCCCLKVTYRLQHGTLTNTTPLTRPLVCILRSAGIIVCRSSFVANSTKKHKRFGETFTLEYARLYSSLLPRKCGHVCTRLVCEPVNDGVYRLQTLPDLGALSSYTIFGLSKF